MLFYWGDFPSIFRVFTEDIFHIDKLWLCLCSWQSFWIWEESTPTVNTRTGMRLFMLAWRVPPAPGWHRRYNRTTVLKSCFGPMTSCSLFNYFTVACYACILPPVVIFKNSLWQKSLAVRDIQFPSTYLQLTSPLILLFKVFYYEGGIIIRFQQQ